MKKFLFLLSCLALPILPVSNVLAQDVEAPKEIEPADEVEALQELETQNEEITTLNDNGGQADLNSIKFSFCNEGIDSPTKSLNATMEIGQPFHVCMLLDNLDAENDAYLDLTFIAGGKNEAGYNICGLDSLTEFITSGSFGQITIPAGNYLIKEFDLVFPYGYEGEQSTCIGISSVDRNPSSAGGLKILARKVYYATFFVGGGDGLKNILSISDLQTKLDENDNLILSFYVKNDGNMENSYDIQGNIKGLFNFQKEFLATSGRVIPGGSQYIEIPLGTLPSYGGLFKINVKINGTPYFSYDISDAKIDPTMLEPKSFEFTTKYFKMPWLICGVVLFFIILIILLFRRPKQKVVYVQQPQQPVQPQQPQYNPQNYQHTVQQQTPRPMQPINPNQQ